MERLRIGMVAKRGGVNLETIRYYERRHLLPKPPRTASGYRIFGEDAVDRIRFIKRAQIMRYLRSKTACALCLYSAIPPILVGSGRLEADRLKGGGIRPGGRS